ncbi:MAG: winged helix-turn-helix domain-containing protein [Enterocloster sp.]
MYERIYEILKDRIESGVLPAGTKLPSRDSLCREFGTSGKTIRRVLSMLKENGLIETHQRKRPVVSFRQQTRRPMIHLALEESRSPLNYQIEVLKTGVLLGVSAD